MAFTDATGQVVGLSASGTTPFTSLSDASEVGPGEYWDNVVCRSSHALAVTASAEVDDGAVSLEASLDGVNFFTIGSISSLAASSAKYVAVANSPSRFIRATIMTAISGGDTVSALVGSA